jgi:hypothetical protein
MPGVALTRLRSAEFIALIKVDLPTFDLPRKTTSGTSIFWLEAFLEGRHNSEVFQSSPVHNLDGLWLLKKCAAAARFSFVGAVVSQYQEPATSD